MSAISVRSYEYHALKWRPDGGIGWRFAIINTLVLAIFVWMGMQISSVELPKKERQTRVVVPERVSQFILRKEKSKPKPPPKLPDPIKKKKEPEKLKPVIKRPPKKVQAKKPLTKKEKKNVKKAQASGLLALSNELADLMDTTEISAMVNSNIRSSGATKAATVDTNALAVGESASGNGGKVKVVSSSSSTIRATKLSQQERTAVKQALMTRPPAGSNPKSQKGQSTGRSGSGSGSGKFRSDEDIAYVMDKNKGKLYSVYRQARRKNPGLKGRIVFDVTILPSGAVSKVVIKSSELNDSRLEARLLARVKRFNFGPKDGESITITYPIEFLPS